MQEKLLAGLQRIQVYDKARGFAASQIGEPRVPAVTVDCNPRIEIVIA
jgi:hypothetical protein